MISAERLSDDELGEEITELKMRVDRCIESFGGAPAALRKNLAMREELVQLRAQGLSQEDREALEAGARELSITAVDYEHHSHKLLLAKEQDSLAIKARAHAAILRRLGGQTT